LTAIYIKITKKKAKNIISSYTRS